MKERSNLAAATAAMAVVAAVLLVYFGLYWMLMDDSNLSIGYYSRQGTVLLVVQREVSYRYGGQFARAIFGPAHQCDRKLRPRHWELGPAGIDGVNLEAR